MIDGYQANYNNPIRLGLIYDVLTILYNVLNIERGRSVLQGPGNTPLSGKKNANAGVDDRYCLLYHIFNKFIYNFETT